MRKLLKKIDWTLMTAVNVIIGAIIFVVCLFISFEVAEDYETRHLFGTFAMLGIMYTIVGAFICMELESYINK